MANHTASWGVSVPFGFGLLGVLPGTARSVPIFLLLMAFAGLVGLLRTHTAESPLSASDTQLYSVGIFDSIEYRSRTPEELSGPSLLNEMTQLTGGRAFSVENLNDLPDIAAKIGVELRNQYVLAYHPSNKAHDARWRKIKIKRRDAEGASCAKRVFEDRLLRAPSLSY